MLDNPLRIILEAANAMEQHSNKIDSGVPNLSGLIATTIGSTENSTYISKRFTPSSSNLCSRFEAYKRINNFKIEKIPYGDDTTIKFALGSAIHDALQQKGMAPHGNNLYGSWECPVCGTVYANQLKPKSGCFNGLNIAKKFNDIAFDKSLIHCNNVGQKDSVDWVYREMRWKAYPIDHKDYAISTALDGLWIVDDGWYLIEIKTIDDNLYNNTYLTKSNVDGVDSFLKRGKGSRLPLDSHVTQTQRCLGIINEAIDKKEITNIPGKCLGGILIYVNRASGESMQYALPYEVDTYNYMKYKVKETWDAVQANDIMQAPPSCKNRDTAGAKRCILRDTCFPKTKTKQ